MILLLIGLPPLMIHLTDYVSQCEGVSDLPSSSWDRSLDSVELFSGKGELTAAMRRAGFRAQWFDWLHRPDDMNNLLTVAGMMQAVKDTLRLREGGLLFGGVPCSSWVWLSCPTHMRHVAILGDSRQEMVRIGNILGARFCLLAGLALVIGAHWAVEQPSTSRFIHYPYMTWLERVAKCFFKRFPMANYHHFSLKPSYLCGSPLQSQRGREGPC